MADRAIALDADGVIIDYHEGYRAAWKKAFGEELRDHAPLSYHAKVRFQARDLTSHELAHLASVGFDEETWFSMPLLPGVKEAVSALSATGTPLVVVSALPPHMGPARLAGLRAHGLNVQDIFAVGGAPGTVNPKKQAISQLNPLVLVDDCAPFLEGLPSRVARVLIESGAPDSPNLTYSGPPADEVYPNLSAFAKAWIPRLAG